MREAYVTMKVYWNEKDFAGELTLDQIREIIQDGDDTKLHYFVKSVGGIVKR